MSILGALSVSVQGMRSQATALGIIGTNVANVQTGGYKRSDPFFQTLKSQATFEQSDLNSNKIFATQQVAVQGNLTNTNSDLDLAIIGDGLFVTRNTFDTSGETFYTRDGSFSMFSVSDISVTDPATGVTTQSRDAYLIDKNGNFLLGFPSNADGTFPTTGTPVPLRVDPNVFTSVGRATSLIDLGFNLDSNASVLSTASPISGSHANAVSELNNFGTRTEGMEIFTIDFVDSVGIRQQARMNFTKGAANEWDMSLTYQGAATAQIDEVTIGGTINLGDSYSIVVDGATISYTAVSGDTQTSVVNTLISRLNASNPIASVVTAAAGSTAGTITLTADTAGNAFTTSTSGATVATPTANSNGLTDSGTGITTITFDGSGNVISPTAPLSFSITYPTPATGSAGTASFTMDVTDFTQFASRFQRQRYLENGIEAEAISRVGFDQLGHVVGYFSSGNSVNLYQVPLANFINPNGLASENGMIFRETEDSGSPTIQTIVASGKATFVPSAIEISNVSLVDEFSAIIKTQRAYSSCATAFQTAIDMLVVAKDMKR